MPSDKKNSSWLSFQFIITLIFSLLILKLNLKHYGEKPFCIWILLASIWGFGAILDFGFNTAIVKYVAEFRNETKKINKLLSSSLFVFLITGLAILIIGSIIGYLAYLNNQKIIPKESQIFYIIVFVILGLSFYLQYLSWFFKAIMEGMNNFILTSKLAIFQNSLMLAGTIIISVTKQNLIALSVLYFVTNFIILFSYILYFRIKTRNFLIKINLFDFKEVKRILGFSLSVQAMNVFSALIDPIVKYMLGTYLDVRIIPAYEIARRFAIAISGLFFNAYKIVLPKASILKTEKEIKNFILDDLIRYCKIGITYSGIAFGILSLPIVFIINSVFGIKEATLIFIILSIPETINNFGYPIYNFLLGIGKANLLVIVQITNLICVIVGLFVGFNIFHNLFGLLSYFISVMIGNILMIIYLKNRWTISLTDFLTGVNIYKLGILIFFLSIVLLSIKKEFFSVYFDFAALSVLSYLVFYRDIHRYIKIFIGRDLFNTR